MGGEVLGDWRWFGVECGGSVKNAHGDDRQRELF
jgi:hypothetical protein